MKFLKIRKNILLLFVISITFMLSGCENSVEILSNAATYSQTVKSEITVTETTRKEVQKKEYVAPIGKDSYGSPAYPLYGDWTFEKIANLIEIDGVPLSLSSDVEYFNNINKKFKAEQDKDLTNYYDVYYNNKPIIMAKKSQEKSDMSFAVSSFKDNQENNDVVTFAGYSFSDSDEIYSYMNENFTVSINGEVGKRYSFINDKLILELSFFENNDDLSLIVVSIKEEE